MYELLPPILYKDSANERNTSLLAYCRVPPILYKDSANVLKCPQRIF